MEKGLIFDIDRFSTHDGPGIRAAVFLKGCPLSCEWCHSPESQKGSPELIYQETRCSRCGKCAAVCPEKAITGGDGITIDRTLCKSCFACTNACLNHALRVCGTWRGADEVMEILLQDKPFYDNSGGGVTVTGGELLSQAGFARELLSLCKQSGIHTAIETSGFGSRAALLEIAGLCDLIYYDIKLTDDVLHKRYTGSGNALILENLALLCEAGNADKITVRIPCIPGINDDPEQIAEIARLARRHGVKSVELMPYNASADAKYDWLGRIYPLSGLEPSPPEYYDNLNDIINN